MPSRISYSCRGGGPQRLTSVGAAAHLQELAATQRVARGELDLDVHQVRTAPGYGRWLFHLMPFYNFVCIAMHRRKRRGGGSACSRFWLSSGEWGILRPRGNLALSCKPQNLGDAHLLQVCHSGTSPTRQLRAYYGCPMSAPPKPRDTADDQERRQREREAAMVRRAMRGWFEPQWPWPQHELTAANCITGSHPRLARSHCTARGNGRRQRRGARCDYACFPTASSGTVCCSRAIRACEHRGGDGGDGGASRARCPALSTLAYMPHAMQKRKRAPEEVRSCHFRRRNTCIQTRRSI